MPLFGLGKYWDTLVLSLDEQFAVITSRGDRRIRGLDWLPVVPSGAGPPTMKTFANQTVPGDEQVGSITC
jgi:hypothetical protein